jgi:hypothetical protein
MLDLIAQIGLTVLSPLSIILVAKKNKWGFVTGLFSEPFWFATAIINKQWGVFAVTIVFTFSWILGIYEWFFKKDDKK